LFRNALLASAKTEKVTYQPAKRNYSFALSHFSFEDEDVPKEAEAVNHPRNETDSYQSRAERNQTQGNAMR
jgi:hypothetical protein